MVVLIFNHSNTQLATNIHLLNIYSVVGVSSGHTLMNKTAGGQLFPGLQGKLTKKLFSNLL